MFFKFFSYHLERQKASVPIERHYSLFRSCRGPDRDGVYASYRGRRDSVLMHVRGNADRFMGLIGRHSEERDVTRYDAEADEAVELKARDDDYPNAAFICVPNVQMIACGDSSPISAQMAMRRLHAVIGHRAKLDFVYDPVRSGGDLAFATRNFRVIEVVYETLPVNPHTGDLGRQLDENNKRDHIARSLGNFKATDKRPLVLNGGHLSQVHDLQRSGHARVGYTALTKEDDEISVSKPSHPTASRGSRKIPDSEQPELRLKIEGEKPPYPLPDEYVERVVDVMERFGPQVRR